MKKKVYALLLCFLLPAAALLSACASSGNGRQPQADTNASDDSGSQASADASNSAHSPQASSGTDDSPQTANGTTAASNGGASSGQNVVYVYNWGEYIDPETIDGFEAETGIRVVYDEYETNETMYPKVAAGASQYDVICPSDYMIQKLWENDLLQLLDFDKLPNAVANIGAQYYEQAQDFDPGNRYSVPYCWGTVGILYNRTMVDGPVDSWSILWDEKYRDDILMQDSVRDAFMVALKLQGDSMNTTDAAQLARAKELLISQKPLVQAYVVDQVRDKMIGGEAALGVIYSGEAIYTKQENPDLEYVVPKEGTNVWIDGWVIPKNAPNPDNAHKFIDYMCRADVALKNFEYITYSTPNDAARALIEDESIRNSPIAFPDLDDYEGLETFRYLGDAMDKVYYELWKQVKSA